MRESVLLGLVVAVTGAVAGPGLRFWKGGFREDGSRQVQYTHKDPSSMEAGPRKVASYKVIKETETYELRDYGQITWVCSEEVINSMTMKEMKKGKKKGKNNKKKMPFLELFNYLKGRNSMGQEVGMTAPIRKQKTVVAGGVKVELCHYLPTSPHQTIIPAPMDPELWVDTWHTYKVAARRIDGQMTEKTDWELAKASLKKDLQEAGEEGVDFTKVYWAVYPSPQPEDMRGEVWFQMA